MKTLILIGIVIVLSLLLTVVAMAYHWARMNKVLRDIEQHEKGDK